MIALLNCNIIDSFLTNSNGCHNSWIWDLFSFARLRLGNIRKSVFYDHVESHISELSNTYIDVTFLHCLTISGSETFSIVNFRNDSLLNMSSFSNVFDIAHLSLEVSADTVIFLSEALLHVYMMFRIFIQSVPEHTLNECHYATTFQ